MKTNKKVKIVDGRQCFIRTVYISEYGKEYFKYNNHKCYIFQKINKRNMVIYYSPFINSVEYVEV